MYRRVVRGSAWPIASWMSWRGTPGVVEAGGEGMAQTVWAELAGRFQAGVVGQASNESPGLSFADGRRGR